MLLRLAKIEECLNAEGIRLHLNRELIELEKMGGVLKNAIGTIGFLICFVHRVRAQLSENSRSSACFACFSLGKVCQPE